MASGRFVAYVWNCGTSWYVFSPCGLIFNFISVGSSTTANVDDVSFSEVLLAEAYLLLYKKSRLFPSFIFVNKPKQNWGVYSSAKH